jgi:flagellar protein FlaG
MNNDISKVVPVAFTPLARDLSNSQKMQTDSKKESQKSSESTQDASNSNKPENKVTSLDEARKLAEEGNKILESVQRNLQFKIDDSTKQVVMSIVDKATGELIKQIPSEEVLAHGFLIKTFAENQGNGAIAK